MDGKFLLFLLILNSSYIYFMSLGESVGQKKVYLKLDSITTH